jgi:hypothetical protein
MRLFRIFLSGAARFAVGVEALFRGLTLRRLEQQFHPALSDPEPRRFVVFLLGLIGHHVRFVRAFPIFVVLVH